MDWVSLYGFHSRKCSDSTIEIEIEFQIFRHDSSNKFKQQPS